MEQIIAKPTPNQLQWADMELGVIIHFVISMYKPNVKYKTKEVREKLPPQIFAPEGWDTDQWMRSASEMGAKYAVMVANHCEGFSLWQTKVNDYSVASCKYKDGKGDIIREFIESCKKYDIKPGLYYSTGCNGYYDIDDGKNCEAFWQTEQYKEYVKNVEAQVTELWSEYGELFEIWFDGGVIPVDKGGPNLVPILKKYQPNAICFQGPKDYPHNVRWVGNEDGLAPIECWAATNAGEARFDGTVPDEKAGVGNPDGKYFWPAETDMPNRDHGAAGGGWSWAENQKDHAFTKEQLLNCYIRSVGRNSNLLLGMGIAKNGRFEDEEQFIEFGKIIKETFGEEAKIAAAEGNDANIQVLKLDKPSDIKYIVLRENMENGHCIRKFKVTCDGAEAASGECIGHKRIIPVSLKGVNEVKFEITESAGKASLRDIAVF